MMFSVLLAHGNEQLACVKRHGSEDVWAELVALKWGGVGGMIVNCSNLPEGLLLHEQCLHLVQLLEHFL